ncbi:MAG: hypothetical protein ACR2QH_02265 [Geminicoccaceae bacterium]
MTTIAYRNNIMAADSACFDSSLYQGEVEKLWILPSVGLIGCCGEIGAMIRVVDWLRDGGERKRCPDLPDDCEFEGIVVSREGEVLHYDRHLVPIRVANEFHAIGSGRKLALGAMMAGASAKRAVQIACQYDNGSREPVRTLKLRDLKADAQA